MFVYRSKYQCLFIVTKINTIERLRLRLQICLNLTPVSTCLNFGSIVYFIETQVQQPKIIKNEFNARNQLRRFLNWHMIHSSLVKNNEGMTYQFMKLLSNVKQQYFSFANVVTMPSINPNNLKLLYLSLHVLNNQSEIETN